MLSPYPCRGRVGAHNVSCLEVASGCFVVVEFSRMVTYNVLNIHAISRRGSSKVLQAASVYNFNLFAVMTGGDKYTRIQPLGAENLLLKNNSKMFSKSSPATFYPVSKQCRRRMIAELQKGIEIIFTGPLFSEHQAHVQKTLYRGEELRTFQSDAC